MNRIIVTELADSDLDDIWLGIALENESAANRIVDEIKEVTRKLATFPRMGRAADMLRVGARIAIHGDYLVVYRPMDYGIAVLRACMVPESGRSLNIHRRRKSRGQLNFWTVTYAKTTEAIDLPYGAMPPSYVTARILWPPPDGCRTQYSVP